MLYLFAVINLVLTSLSGLAFFNIYKSVTDLGWLEIAVMFISLILLLVSNIAILWVNRQRGSIISELKRKNNMLQQELASQEQANKMKKQD